MDNDAAITPAIIEAGLEILTERWPDWPYGERRVSLMLADVFREMKACELREKALSDSIADRKNLCSLVL
jgi:hypothetical protein